MVLPFGFLPLHRSRRFPRSLQKPVPGSRHLHAGHRPDSKQASSGLIPETLSLSGLDDIYTLSTLQQWFRLIRLPGTYLIRSWRTFSLTLTTMAFGHSSLRGFEASTCMAAPRGLPSSSIEHSFSPSWRTLGIVLASDF